MGRWKRARESVTLLSDSGVTPSLVSGSVSERLGPVMPLRSRDVRPCWALPTAHRPVMPFQAIPSRVIHAVSNFFNVPRNFYRAGRKQPCSAASTGRPPCAPTPARQATGIRALLQHGASGPTDGGRLSLFARVSNCPSQQSKSTVRVQQRLWLVPEAGRTRTRRTQPPPPRRSRSGSG